MTKPPEMQGATKYEQEPALTPEVIRDLDVNDDTDDVIGGCATTGADTCCLNKSFVKPK